jgi:hypothetical protein
MANCVLVASNSNRLLGLVALLGDSQDRRVDLVAEETLPFFGEEWEQIAHPLVAFMGNLLDFAWASCQTDLWRQPEVRGPLSHVLVHSVAVIQHHEQNGKTPMELLIHIKEILSGAGVVFFGLPDRRVVKLNLPEYGEFKALLQQLDRVIAEVRP